MSRTELPAGMAVGFRFYPTDEELIKSYLKPKLLGRDSEVDHVVAEVDFCKFEPWQLPSKSKIKSKDRMWLFFCVQNLMFVSNKSTKKKTDETGIWKITGRRKTETGTWKVTGEERMIKDRDTKECIGKKRTLVFYGGPTAGEKSKWAMQLYYIIPDHPLPNQVSGYAGATKMKCEDIRVQIRQSIYVLCRLKEKAVEKTNTLHPKEGEPRSDITSEVENPIMLAAISRVRGLEEDNMLDSEEGEPSSNITSEVENPITPAAISEAHGLEEVNQESLLWSLHSPVCHFTDEDFSLLESIGFLRGQDKMPDLCGAGEPEGFPKETDAEGVNERLNFLDAPASSDADPKVVNEQRPYAICHFENKKNENAGTLGCDNGEPSDSHNIPAIEISEAYVHAEVNADLLLQAQLSLDCYLTGRDIRSIFSNNFEDNQKFNSVMHEYHCKPENSLPKQGLYAVSLLDNRTDENASTQGCDIGSEPSSSITSDTKNQVTPTTTLEAHSDTNANGDSLSLPLLSPNCYLTEDRSLILSNNLNDGHNKRQAQCGGDELKESPQELLNSHKENNCGEPASSLFYDSIPLKSLKRSCTDTEGVDGRAKRSCSLALGESLQ